MVGLCRAASDPGSHPRQLLRTPCGERKKGEQRTPLTHPLTQSVPSPEVPSPAGSRVGALAVLGEAAHSPGRTERTAGVLPVGSAVVASGCHPGSPARACRRSLWGTHGRVRLGLRDPLVITTAQSARPPSWVGKQWSMGMMGGGQDIQRAMHGMWPEKGSLPLSLTLCPG